MLPSWVFNFAPEKFKGKIYNKFFNSIEAHHKYKSKFLKAQLKYAPGAHLFNLHSGDVISGNIAFTGLYEADLSRHITALAKEGGRLLDVGANIGYFSTLWLANNMTNTTSSFEASPAVYKMLENNIEKNGFAKRADLYKFAAGNEEGTIRFDTGPSEQTGWGGIVHDTESLNCIDVPMKRIDSLISTEIDVMKIDIEGAELFAFQGCENLFQEKKIKHIFFENNIGRMKALNIMPDQVDSYLRNFGFKVESIVQNKGQDVEMIAYL